MDKQYLRSTEFNKSTIMASVFSPHNFDGVKASSDVRALVREEQARTFCRQLTFLGLGGTLFSLYNITRIGQLSPSGKSAAIGGLILFSYLTYGSGSRAGMIGGSKSAAV